MKYPLIADYLKKKIVTHDDYMIGYFKAFCSPRTEEFILSNFQNTQLILQMMTF